MFFASDKNFPKFVHSDSVVKNYDPSSRDYFIVPSFSKPSHYYNHKNERNMTNASNSIENSFERKNGFSLLEKNNNDSFKSKENEQFDSNNGKIIMPLMQTSSMEKSLEKNILSSMKTGHQIKLSPIKHRPSPIPKNSRKISEHSEFDEHFELKNRYFLKMMNYNNNKHPEEKISQDFLRNLILKKRKSRNPAKKLAINTTTKINTNVTTSNIKASGNRTSIEVLSPGLASLHKLSLMVASFDSFENSYKNFKKGLTRKFTTSMSMMEIAMKRSALIPNYKDLVAVLKRLEKSLGEYTASMGFNNRTANIFKGLLSKKIDMSHLFFNEEDGKLLEPLDIHFIEEQCVIKEKFFETGKLATKWRVDPIMISELQSLSEKLEELNSTKYINDLKLTKDSLLTEYKQMKELENEMSWNTKFKNVERMPKFNFEIMPNIPLMKNLDEFERQYGECDLIDKKSKMIGKVLEEVIGEMKKNTVSNVGEQFCWKKKNKHGNK